MKNTTATPKLTTLMSLTNEEERKKYLAQFKLPEPEPLTPQEIENNIRLQMLGYGIPPKKVYAEESQIKKSLWADIQASLKRWDSMFFYGAVGSGKSCILSCIMRQIVRDNRHSVRYVSAYDFALQVSRDIENHFNYVRTIEEYANVDILMIDDIGAIGLNESQRTALIFLLNKIYDQDSMLIIASNSKIEEIPEVIDERIGSRLKEKCVYFKLSGSDRRGKR